MTHLVGTNRGVLAVTLCLGGLSLASATTSFDYALKVSAWTCVEIFVSLLTTTLIGLVAVFAASRRSVRLLDLAVSRGLEVTAALPIVLVSAVTVVTFGWRMPYAVALVTGALNGLTCLRMVTLGKSKAVGRAPLVRFKHALTTSVSELVPQLVGLEAAIAFLGLFDSPWKGGLGQPLGTAATNCNYLGIFIWSLLCIGTSVGTQQLLRLLPGSPKPVTQSAIRSTPTGTAS